eukprot:4611593-Prymnesium_polylepis.1
MAHAGRQVCTHTRWTAVRKRCHPVRMHCPSVCRTLEMSGFGEQPMDIASIDNASKVKVRRCVQ